MTPVPRELHELPKVIKQVQRKASRPGLCSVDEMRGSPRPSDGRSVGSFCPYAPGLGISHDVTGFCPALTSWPLERKSDHVMSKFEKKKKKNTCRELEVFMPGSCLSKHRDWLAGWGAESPAQPTTGSGT